MGPSSPSAQRQCESRAPAGWSALTKGKRPTYADNGGSLMGVLKLMSCSNLAASQDGAVLFYTAGACIRSRRGTRGVGRLDYVLQRQKR